MSKGVSVFIPFYAEDGRFLKEAVNSVLEQKTNLPYEIIIVNDGSDAPVSLEALDDIRAMNLPNIQILEFKENCGVAVARNMALEVAQYDVIAPLDVDNRFSTKAEFLERGQGWIDRGYEALQDPDVMMVRVNAMRFGGMQGQWNLPKFDEQRILTNNMVDAHAMYRREEALAVGGYNPRLRYMDDWDFTVAMLTQRYLEGRNAHVETIEEPVFEYRVRSDKTNLSSAQNTDDFYMTLGAMYDRSKLLYQSYYPDLKDIETSDVKAFLFEKHQEYIRKSRDYLSLTWLSDKFKRAVDDPEWFITRVKEFVSGKPHVAKIDDDQKIPDPE